MSTDSTRPLLSFQVITDTHVTADPEHSYNRNLEQVLQDIAENAGSSCGIMHAGDVTDHGFPGEYGEFARILSRYQDRLPPLYVTMGNHDVALGEWSSRLTDFLSATGMTASYHDHWIDGHHFIFLGTELGLELYCTLSEEQLAWLDAKLGEDASAGKPVFVFLHQPLKDTVAGTVEPHQWYGVTEDEELKAVLSGYRQAILFTGHGHWELESSRTYYDGEGKLPAMFNAASIAYLWTDKDERKEGSQGYYVKVYADHVRVRGRDFATGIWVEAAQFRVDYPVR